MQRSTLILGLASLAGAPILILPEPRATLGSNLVVGLSLLCLVGLMAGLASWFWEHQNRD
jgi:hypothetical protein